ncbi:MAG: hypothetical protein JOZ82_00740 [Marmoricola sp.]|nr:hypothetical protein [Marmoricola sp.]
MAYERLAYDDQDTTVQMHDDCLVCASHMRLPHQPVTPAAVELDVPSQRASIEVTDATADLASRLYLG